MKRSDPGPHRFVVLKHTPAAALTRTSNVHFDWMFEWEGTLQTWATEVVDLSNATVVDIGATRLEDHRMKYLQYEGPISKDRGEVTPILRGSFLMLRDDPATKTMQLMVPNLINRHLELTWIKEDHWQLHLR